MKMTTLDKPGRAASLCPRLPGGQTDSLWTFTWSRRKKERSGGAASAAVWGWAPQGHGPPQDPRGTPCPDVCTRAGVAALKVGCPSREAEGPAASCWWSGLARPSEGSGTEESGAQRTATCPSARPGWGRPRLAGWCGHGPPVRILPFRPAPASPRTSVHQEPGGECGEKQKALPESRRAGPHPRVPCPAAASGARLFALRWGHWGPSASCPRASGRPGLARGLQTEAAGATSRPRLAPAACGPWQEPRP